MKFHRNLGFYLREQWNVKSVLIFHFIGKREEDYTKIISARIFIVSIILFKGRILAFCLRRISVQALMKYSHLNPFQPCIPFLYPLKKSGNQSFPVGIEVEHWLEMG